MITIICLTRQSRRPAALKRLQGTAIAIATLVCLGGIAAENAAEQVDSGWAVATPIEFAPSNRPADPEQQFVLRHLLQQTQQPILKNPSPTQVPHVSKAQPNLRIAVRPDGVDGWRPAAQHVSPLGEPWPLELAAPETDAAEAEAVESDEQYEDEQGCGAEQDCGDTERDSRFTESESPALVQPSVEAEQNRVEAEEVEVSDSDDTTAEQDESGITATEPQQLEQEAAESATTDSDAAAETRSELAEEESTENDDSQTSRVEAKPTQIEPTEVPPPPLTKQLVALRSRVRAVLKGYYRKPLNSREHDPWEAMHGMLAYGVHSRILDGGPRGKPITSVGWLCFNKPCKGQSLLYVTPKDELRAKYGVGLQGHLGQLLAMLAQCKVSPDYPIHVGKKEFTISDLIEAEKKTCYPKSELTFKLLALQHYIDLDDTWVNDQGVEWDFSRMLREELAQPMRNAACGGTHRLSALTLTVKARQRRGAPIDGEYKRAAEFVEKHHQLAFRLQNRDGSLSTSWFRGRGDEDDLDRRIKTTGHILEWLCYSLTDEQLRDQRTIRSVMYLTNIMYTNYDHEWEIGPRSHATHAMLLYDERVFQPFDKPGEVASYRPGANVAKRPQQRTNR